MIRIMSCWTILPPQLHVHIDQSLCDTVYALYALFRTDLQPATHGRMWERIDFDPSGHYRRAEPTSVGLQPRSSLSGNRSVDRGFLLMSNMHILTYRASLGLR